MIFTFGSRGVDFYTRGTCLHSTAGESSEIFVPPPFGPGGIVEERSSAVLPLLNIYPIGALCSTDWLNNFMEQILFSEASNRSAIQEISCVLWNSIVQYHVHKSPTLDPF